MLDGYDIPTSIVDANLQIRERGITDPWDTRQISNRRAEVGGGEDKGGEVARGKGGVRV